jgi:hypothetical protein
MQTHMSWSQQTYGRPDSLMPWHLALLVSVGTTLMKQRCGIWAMNPYSLVGFRGTADGGSTRRKDLGPWRKWTRLPTTPGHA